MLAVDYMYSDNPFWPMIVSEQIHTDSAVPWNTIPSTDVRTISGES